MAWTKTLPCNEILTLSEFACQDYCRFFRRLLVHFVTNLAHDLAHKSKTPGRAIRVFQQKTKTCDALNTTRQSLERQGGAS